MDCCPADGLKLSIQGVLSFSPWHQAPPPEWLPFRLYLAVEQALQGLDKVHEHIL